MENSVVTHAFTNLFFLSLSQSNVDIMSEITDVKSLGVCCTPPGQMLALSFCHCVCYLIPVAPLGMCGVPGMGDQKCAEHSDIPRC